MAIELMEIEQMSERRQNYLQFSKCPNQIIYGLILLISDNFFKDLYAFALLHFLK